MLASLSSYKVMNSKSASYRLTLVAWRLRRKSYIVAPQTLSEPPILLTEFAAVLQSGRQQLQDGIIRPDICADAAAAAANRVCRSKHLEDCQGALTDPLPPEEIAMNLSGLRGSKLAVRGGCDYKCKASSSD